MNAKSGARERFELALNGLIGLSHRIHAHPELGFEEERASSWLCESLTEAGFAVEKGICDLPTAFHTEHMPSSFYPRAMRPGLVVLETRFPEATQQALVRRGHRLGLGQAWSEGRLSACAREDTPEGMIVKAAANPRGMQGYAVGR